LAVIHAQFEILHPFNDGNGRLGRILIPLFLHERKLLARPVFYLSEWLEERRENYIGALRNLSEHQNGWNHWIEFFLTGIEEQAARNSAKARAIMELYERSKRQVIDMTRSHQAVPLLDQLFRQPVFQSSHLKFDVTKATIMGLLRTLKDAGIITIIREGSGRRAAFYAFAELINICEGEQVV
jgi:Fic family protein